MLAFLYVLSLENYAKWQVIYPLLKFLGDGYVNAYYTFMLNANPGAEVLTERNDMCIDVLEKVMPIALGRVYAEFILPEGSRVSLMGQKPSNLTLVCSVNTV